MHSIVFNNCENNWKNALPLGNGVFGAMAFFSDNALYLPMNHYEIYYNIGESVLPEDILKNQPPCKAPGELRQETIKRADGNQPEGDESFTYYRIAKKDTPKYSVMGFDGSYPQTGELKFEFSDKLKDESTCLRLDIEKATVSLNIGNAFSLKTRILRKDAIVTHFSGGKEIESILFGITEQRSRDFPEIEYKQLDSSTFYYTVKMALSQSKSFSFAVILMLQGAEGSLEENKIILKNQNDSFCAVTGVYTEWNYLNPLSDGIEDMKKTLSSLDILVDEHQAYWKEFFQRSSIDLPDKFLEKVYYINQYALDCSSGKNGIMKHHACGLNGLWDVRHPNLWGSMWYWDVNIQAAFAGVFSSNRLDLGKVFSDGLLSYVDLAKQFAKDVHGFEGAALDYPYAFYFSTWPWCAQYLWAQYEYSLDKDYLKNEAYPLFLELSRFALKLFEYDESRKEYVVYPDISPEQGPLAHNSVITVASVKYMLKFTLESAEILGDDDPLLKDIRRLYEGMPKYPTARDDYGERFLDSEDAPKNLWIRHPSMLMPVFPTGEIHMESDPKLKEIVMNTVRFLEKHCEIGVFQVSWLSAVSARMGDGQRALRLLYEMGLDHMLRSNGLSAEVTERFMNYCLIMRQPLYYPCMMEFTGEMLSAVNEMLMQSNGGIIRLFPAMPTGDRENERMKDGGYAQGTFEERFSLYPAWNDVRFDKLLARGAFEVSASLKNGEIEFIKVRSKMGGRLRITSPYPLNGIAPCENNIIELDTKAGEEYVFGTFYEKEEKLYDEVDTHLTYTKRRISIGEDPETLYSTALDSFIRDWYLGNVRMENHNVYKFDFGLDYEKDYSKDLFRQFYGAEEMVIGSMNFNRLSGLEFTAKRGYGFNSAEGIVAVDRGAPDALRRDLLEGEKPVTFMIEAPAGQYELFVVSGDSEEESLTRLSCNEGRTCGGEVIKRGQFQYKVIPLVHEKDGLIKLDISTEKGKKWKLNYILMNLYKQL